MQSGKNDIICDWGLSFDRVSLYSGNHYEYMEMIMIVPRSQAALANFNNCFCNCLVLARSWPFETTHLY